jgi:hypothetical protein
MPSYRFTAEIPYDYPASRDSYGVLLGTVKPGDVLDLPEPPDMWWTPYEDGSEGEATPEPQPDASPATDQTSEAGESGSEES